MSAALSTADARTVLPEGRLAGPMPYVMAIMTVLTVLAVAAGIALGGAASALGRDLAGRLTVQIVDANPDQCETQAKAALVELSRLAIVRSAVRVDDAKMRALLEPWLGRDGLDGELPIPVLIDVTLSDGGAQNAPDIVSTLRRVAPSARVEPHARFLAPVAALLTGLQILAALLIALMAMATAAVVILSARAALDTHRDTIDIMHLMGASDAQIAGLFQRRAALDALFGSGIGLILGATIVALLSWQFAAIEAVLVERATLGWLGWLALPLVTAAAVGLSAFTARTTVLRALGKAL